MSEKSTLQSVEQHSPWLELVAPYVDGELSDASAKEMERHVATCRLCQREAEQQRAVARRLRDLRRPEPIGAPDADSDPRSGQKSRRRRRSLRPALAWGGWGFALAQAIVIAVLVMPLQQGASVPMVEEALADFQRVTTGALPLREQNPQALARALSLPIETLKSPRAKLLGAWPTRLRGEAAAAIAYRVDGRVIIQYVVSEPLFFGQARVREAVSRHGRYVTRQHGDSVVAWPGRHSGSLLVGRVPASELERLAI
ncbi:anti-sigma factor family protein [Salinisphaera hydrothermalis]|uniref:anti-sigma factor family protein n=1 Tax=Salinisphaera hydrothermalis TaxID=563188 RepID=UPI00333E5B0F